MYKYKTIIFDMDGTVLNTVTDLKNAINYALTKNGLKTRTEDEVKSFLGNGMKVLVTKSVGEAATEELLKKVSDDFGSHYMSHCNDNTKPYEGIPQLMKKLHDEGVKIAIVSNKPEIAVVELNRLFYNEITDLCMGEREGLKRKPAPDMVLKAMEILNADPASTVYIGDSEVDFETAKNSGLPCISVTWGFRSREHLISIGANMLADSPEDILKYL